MSSKHSTTVHLEIRDHVAHVTFRRPLDGNIIDMGFGREFLAAAFAIESAADVGAIVLTGEGKHFCLGGDLKGMLRSDSGTRAYLSELTTNLHAGMILMARMDAPVIASVNGTAAGAGLGLVLAADLVIAARSAKFVPAYSGVALTPDAGCTYFLPRVVGLRRAMDMFINNRMLDAEQALAWGIVNEIVEGAELAAAAHALAARVAAGPTGAFGALKRLMAESQFGFEAQLGRESRSIAARGASAEGREGIAAFLERRAPKYR